MEGSFCVVMFLFKRRSSVTVPPVQLISGQLHGEDSDGFHDSSDGGLLS